MARIAEHKRKEFNRRLDNNGWKIVERTGTSTLRISCKRCDRQRVTTEDDFLKHKRRPCLCTFMGERMGKLVVIDTRLPRMLKCQCDCGNQVWIFAGTFKNRRSCGCLHEEFMWDNKTFKDLFGKTFGKLKVVGIERIVDYVGTRQYFWKCKCKCGNTTVVAGSNLKSGATENCAECSVKGKHDRKNTITSLVLSMFKKDDSLEPEDISTALGIAKRKVAAVFRKFQLQTA